MARTITREDMVYASFPILKQADAEDGTGDIFVYGRATDGTLDGDLQVVDPAWSGPALERWLSTKANLRVQHSPHLYPAGKGVEVEIDRDGDGAHWLKARVVEDNARKLVKAGVLQDFSIGISRPLVITDITGKAKGGIVTGNESTSIAEVSLVDRGSNFNSGFTLVKGADVDAESPWTFGDIDALLAKIDAAEMAKADPQSQESAESAPASPAGGADAEPEPEPEPVDDGRDELRKAYDADRAVWLAARPKAPADLEAKDGTAFLAKMAAVSAWDRWEAQGRTEGYADPDPGYGVWLTKRNFDPNVGGGVDRDQMPAEDFIDPQGRRFPISSPGDVSDAVSSFGRADPAIPLKKFRARLKAIARRKGPEFVAELPESWGDGTSMGKVVKRDKGGAGFAPGADDDLLPLLDDEAGDADGPEKENMVEADLTKADDDDDDEPADVDDMTAPCPGCGEDFDMSNPPKKCPNCKHRLARLVGKAVDAVLAETEELLAKASEADLLKWKHGWIPEPGDLARLAQGLRGRKRGGGKRNAKDPDGAGGGVPAKMTREERTAAGERTRARLATQTPEGRARRDADQASRLPDVTAKEREEGIGSLSSDELDILSRHGTKGQSRRAVAEAHARHSADPDQPRADLTRAPKKKASPKKSVLRAAKVEKSHTPGHGPSHDLPEHREPDGSQVEALEDDLDQQESDEDETPDRTPTSTSTMGADSDGAYKTLRMHNVLCPAYHPDDTLTAHQLDTIADGINPRWFDARVLKAAAAADPGAIITAARHRDNATALQALPDEWTLAVLDRLHHKFADINPTAMCIPTAALPKTAGLWRRPWPMTPGIGPNAARTPTVDDVATQLLTDNYRPVGGLSTGHVERSWDDISAQAAANTILALHDHIAAATPGLCPMAATTPVMPARMRADARPTPVPDSVTKGDGADPEPGGKKPKVKPALTKRQVDDLVKAAVAEATKTLHDTYQTELAQLRHMVDELGGQPDVTQAPLRSAVRKMASPDSENGEAVPVARQSLVEKAHHQMTAERERAEYLNVLSRSADPAAREWAMSQLAGAH